VISNKATNEVGCNLTFRMISRASFMINFGLKYAAFLVDSYVLTDSFTGN
jgi:hypothetical protein